MQLAGFKSQNFAKEDMLTIGKQVLNRKSIYVSIFEYEFWRKIFMITLIRSCEE